MNKIIFLLFILFLLAFSISGEVNHYYKIELNYDNGNISYTSIIIQPSEKELKTPGITYLAEILSSENKAINVSFFAFPLIRTSYSINPETGLIENEQTTEFNQSKVTLYLPYYANAKQINIYDFNLTKKLTVPVSSFSIENNNNIVNNQIKNNIGELEDKSIQNQSIKKIMIPIFIALIVLAIVIVIILKRRKNTVNLIN